MDKVYVDNNEKATPLVMPEYGEVTLLVKDGKVVKYNVTQSYQIEQNDDESVDK